MSSTIARIFATLPTTSFSSAMQTLVEADLRHRQRQHIRRLSVESLRDTGLNRDPNGQLNR